MAKLKTHLGVAPLTYARTTAGGYTQIYRGDPVPDGLVDPADLDRLIGEGYLGVLEIEVPDETTGPKAGTADAILLEVGDDKALAQVALDEELAKDKPRAGLVAKLEAIVGPAS